MTFWHLLALILFSSLSCCVHSKTSLFVGTLLPSDPNPFVFSPLTAPAVQLAVDHINASPDILPNYEIVLRLRDSACDIGLAGYELYRLLSKTNETKIALIGEACSTVTQPLAQISRHWNVPQFNFLSTSPALDNRKTYPYYYHILPSENALNPSRVALMTSLGWSHSLLLVQPSDLFDLNAKNLRDEMTAAGLNRPSIFLLPNDGDFSDTVKHLKDTDIRILFGLFYEAKGRRTICELYKQGIHAPDYVWVFVGWYHAIDWYLAGDTNCTNEQMAAAVNGHFTVDFAQLRSDYGQVVPTGKTVEEVAREFQRKLNIPTSTPIHKTFQKYSAYGYDVTVALGLVFNEVANQLMSSGQIDKLHNFTYDNSNLVDLINEILESGTFGFEGLTGRVVFYNLIFGNDGTSTGHTEIYYNRHVNDSTLVFRYDNVNGSLTRTGRIRWTTDDGIEPVDARPHTVRYSKSGIFISIAFLASIGIMITLALLLFNSVQRKHWLVKKSVPRLNELVLIGALVIYVSVILLGFDGQFFEFNNSSIVTCFLRTIFLVIGFTTSFGAVLVKTGTDIIGHYVKKAYESLLVVFGTLVFGLLLLVDALIVVLWFALDPWEKGEQIVDQQGRVIFVREKCSSVDFWGYSLIVYKMVVLIMCLVAAIIRFQIHKSRTGVDASYTDLLVFRTGLGVGFATFGFLFVSDPGLQFALVSTSLILLVSTVLVLLFGRQVYTVWKGLPETEMKQSQRHTGYELTGMDREELKELRTKSSDLKMLVEKLLLERPISVCGSLADEVRRVLGYVPGEPRETVTVLQNEPSQKSKQDDQM